MDPLRVGVRQTFQALSVPRRACRGGCSSTRLLALGAGMRSRQPWMLQKTMPYESPKGTFQGVIGQQTLDAQRGVSLHFGTF